MKIYTVKVDRFGNQHWYFDGKLHREGGPAIEQADGSKLWYLDGKCHREDGPAAEYASGNKSWYVDGKLHREDGPACKYADGRKFWYLHGKQLTQAQWLEAVKPKPSCVGKIVEVDGVKYRLIAA